MDKRLTKLFNNLSKTNNKIIELGQKVVPIAAFMLKDGDKIKPKVIICAIPMHGQQEKEIIRQLIRGMAIKMNDMIGYIIMIDSRMTEFDKAGIKVIGVQDVILRMVYTQTEKLANIVPYKGNVVLTKKKTIIKGRTESVDRWDIWNEKESDGKVEEVYYNYKKENPEKYKDVI